MVSRPVFDTAASRNKPSAVTAPPELVLGDKVLGTAYDVVKEVLLHLQKIEELNSAINNVHHLIPLLDSITLTGTKGLSGGGHLADNPVIELDLSNLPEQTGPIDPANDRLVIRSAAGDEERTLTISDLKSTIVAALTTLVGTSQDALNLGSFTGSAVPANLNVKQAIQALATFVDTGFTTRDSQVDTKVSTAVAQATQSIQDIVTYLQAVVVDLNNTTEDIANETDGIGDTVANLSTISANLTGLLSSLQATVAAQDAKIALLTSDVMDKAAGWLIELLNSRVGITESSLEEQLELIDYLTTAVEDKATAASLLDLIARIAEAEGAWDAAAEALEALNEEVTGLNGAIDSLLGSTSSTRDLEERLKKLSTHAMFEGALAYTQRNEIIAQQNTDRAAFAEEIEVLAADNAALAIRTTTLEAETDNLSADLETVEAAFSSATEALAAQITTLNASLGDKVDASVTDALTVTVTEMGSEINAVADALTEVMAGDPEDGIASVKVRMSAQSAPAGVSARYGVEVRAAEGDAFQAAGFYMDILPGNVPRVAFQTSKFFIYDGTTTKSPFIVSGGTVFMQDVYMNAAYISGSLTAGQISVTSLQSLSATLGAVNISAAVAGSFSLGTSNIQSNAVSVSVEAEGGVTFSNASTWTEVASVFINWLTSADNKAKVDWMFKSMENMEYNVRVMFNGSQVGFMRRVRGGIELPTTGFTTGVVSGTSGTFSVQIMRIDSGPNTEIRMGAIAAEVKKR